MVFSFISLALTKEPQDTEKLQIAPAPINQWTLASQILKTDKLFDLFILIRILFQFGMTGLAFFTIFAVKTIQVDTFTVGVLTSLLLVIQVISNPLMGWLSSHWGKAHTFMVGTTAAFFSCLLACLAKDAWILYPTFLLMGIANSTYWTVGLSYSLLFGKGTEKPVYIGLSNTLIGPFVILAPIIGGWMANLGGYRLSFAVSASFSMLATIILWVSRDRWENIEQPTSNELLDESLHDKE